MNLYQILFPFKSCRLDKFNDADTTYTTVPAKERSHFVSWLQILPDWISEWEFKSNGYLFKESHTIAWVILMLNLLDRMKALGKLPLSFQPGEKWQYGLNSDLLGCLIEVISGTNLEDFLTKNIFEPLGMKDTYFNVPASKANRLGNGLYRRLFASYN